MSNTPPPPPPPPAMPASGGAKPVAAKKNRVLGVAEKPPIVPQILLAATEGFGKTTFGAFAPDPVIFMTPGETGYLTLLSADRVPAVPAERVDDYLDLLAWLDALIDDPQGRKTVVIDEFGGVERMMHEHVCETEFGNDWANKFVPWKQGCQAATRHLRGLLARLEKLRDKHQMATVILSHTKVTNFKNPLGPDYGRYQPECDDKYTWPELKGWADCVLFGRFREVVDQDRAERAKGSMGKGKGIGGTDRLIATERRDAFDAKNRYGMDPEVEIPEEPEKVWATVWNAIVG